MRQGFRAFVHLSLLLFLGLAFGYHFFLEKAYSIAEVDHKLYQLLAWQRQLDRFVSLDKALFQGTHNSYNSDAYHNLFRYHDRQQRMSIADQLRYGARFIELDTHYSFSLHSFKKDFLLCHGSSKFNFLPLHWGCSPLDLPLEQALKDVSKWLEQEQNQNEVLIFYIEDHSEGKHDELYALLKDYGITQATLPANGCRPVSADLSKDSVLSAGKQVLFWKDSLRIGHESFPCSEHEQLRKLVFNDLGVMDRRAEDRTFLGSYAKAIAEGAFPRIETVDIKPLMKDGGNIINLDNFVVNDERLYQFLWSWDYDKVQIPDVGSLDQVHLCASMEANGRWQLSSCENANLPVACFQAESNTWIISTDTVAFTEAGEACQALTARFSAPANFIEQQHLNTTRERMGIDRLWLNVSLKEGTIVPGDTRNSLEMNEHGL